MKSLNYLIKVINKTAVEQFSDSSPLLTRYDFNELYGFSFAIPMRVVSVAAKFVLNYGQSFAPIILLFLKTFRTYEAKEYVW